MAVRLLFHIAGRMRPVFFTRSPGKGRKIPSPLRESGVNGPTKQPKPRQGRQIFLPTLLLLSSRIPDLPNFCALKLLSTFGTAILGPSQVVPTFHAEAELASPSATIRGGKWPGRRDGEDQHRNPERHLDARSEWSLAGAYLTTSVLLPSGIFGCDGRLGFWAHQHNSERTDSAAQYTSADYHVDLGYLGIVVRNQLITGVKE